MEFLAKMRSVLKVGIGLKYLSCLVWKIKLEGVNISIFNALVKVEYSPLSNFEENECFGNDIPVLSIKMSLVYIYITCNDKVVMANSQSDFNEKMQKRHVIFSATVFPRLMAFAKQFPYRLNRH